MKNGRMRRLVLATAVLLAALLPTAASAEWQIARSDHFVIYADTKPEKVHAFAEQLERFDAALRILFGLPDSPPVASQQVTIFQLDDEGDIRRVYGKGSAGIAGFYNPRASGAVAFVPRSAGDGSTFDLNAQQVLLHEYTHHFTYLHWSESPNPAWFVEGFAEFAATAKFEKDGSVTIGAPPLYRARSIIDPSLTLKQLLQARVLDLHGEEREAIYGRGWLLTHYLLLTPTRQAQYDKFVKALHDGKPTLEAAQQVFGDLQKLDKQLTLYIGSRLQAYTIHAAALKIGPISVTPLSPGAAAILPAFIQSKRGADDEAAAGVAALAHKLGQPYPNDPAVFEELAEADLDAGNAQLALSEATRAAALDPQSVPARIYQGQAAMRIAAMQHDADPAHWQQVRAKFIAANKLDVDNAQALRLYYESFVVSGQQPTHNAQDALLRAYDIAPFDLGLRMTAASVLLQRDEIPRTRDVLSTIAYDPHAGTLGQFAAHVLEALDKGGAPAAIAVLQAGNDKGASAQAPGGPAKDH